MKENQHFFKPQKNKIESKEEDERVQEIVEAFDNHEKTAEVVSRNSYTLSGLRFLLAAGVILSLVTSVSAVHAN